MTAVIRATMDMLRALASAASISGTRPRGDFLSDRLVQATTKPTLLDAVEAFAAGVGAQIGYVGGRVSAPFLAVANDRDAPAMLQWLRDHPATSAMIAALRDDDDYARALDAIVLPDVSGGTDTVATSPAWPIKLTVTLQTPLAHGADNKAGNATLFRRMHVLSQSGLVLRLPYYGGNALRGQLRDLLADHFLYSMGLGTDRSRPSVSLWFFHAIYAGGLLAEGGGGSKELERVLGKAGAIRADGIRTFRNTLPAMSLLGVALGNRVVSGRLVMGDLRPRCREWGTGNLDASSLFEWLYATRREDDEAHDEHRGMITTTECLRAGVVMDGGCWLSPHATPEEAGALGLGLRLLTEHGMLGAENRRGMGRVAISVDGAPDPEPYLRHLTDRADQIREYLAEIGALANAEQAEKVDGELEL